MNNKNPNNKVQPSQQQQNVRQTASLNEPDGLPLTSLENEAARPKFPGYQPPPSGFPEQQQKQNKEQQEPMDRRRHIASSKLEPRFKRFLRIWINTAMFQKVAETAILVALFFFVLNYRDFKYDMVGPADLVQNYSDASGEWMGRELAEFEFLPNKPCLSLERPVDFLNDTISFSVFKKCDAIVNAVPGHLDRVVIQGFKNHTTNYTLLQIDSLITSKGYTVYQELLLPLPFCQCVKDMYSSVEINCAWSASKYLYLFLGFAALIAIYVVDEHRAGSSRFIVVVMTLFFGYTLGWLYQDSIATDMCYSKSSFSYVCLGNASEDDLGDASHNCRTLSLISIGILGMLYLFAIALEVMKILVRCTAGKEQARLFDEVINGKFDRNIDKVLSSHTSLDDK